MIVSVQEAGLRMNVAIEPRFKHGTEIPISIQKSDDGRPVMVGKMPCNP